MKKYVIKLNEKVYEVEIEEVTGEAGGETAVTSFTKEKAQSSNSNAELAGKGQVIEAPMPGNIVGVSVKVGDVVKNGQVLLILEAMKMENEIVSPIDGKIASVGVSKGDAVNPGDMLVEIV